MNKLILAYCIENQYVAAKITSALKGKIEVEKVVFESGTGIDALKKVTNGNAFPVLLLISDNFLKSERCMNDALSFIQSLGSSQRLIPVTTDGIYMNKETGQTISVTTSFDRVSNVIQFMNYWQDRYLELRKIKAVGDETTHNEKVRVVRTISSEIGELLRYFRTMAFYSYDQFKESNFIILHRVLGIEVTKDMEIEKNIAVSHTILPMETSYTNGSTSSVEPILEDEKPPVELVNIPAIKQLSEQFNVRESSFSGFQDAVANKTHEAKEEIEQVIRPMENRVDEANEVVEQPFQTENNGIPFTIEALIQGIKIEEKDVETDSKNATTVETIADIALEKEEIVEKTNISNISGFTLEQIVKDEELNGIMKKQTPIETIESLANAAQEATDPTIGIHQSDLLDESENELVKLIAAESLEETADIENFKEKSDAEISDDTVDEDAIQQEVARVFDAAEETDPDFDFESEIAQSIESQKEMVVDKIHTEGVVADKTELEKLQQGLIADPYNSTLRYKFAAELTNQNRFVEATEQLDILLDNDRTNVDAYVLLAYLAEQQGDFILSLNSLEKVTLLKPDYPGIYYKLGRLTHEHFKKQNRKALRYFKESVAQDPTNADAQYRYALALIEQNGDFKTAIDHLNIAAEQAPQHDAAIFELAKAYFETNDRANAAKWYARATELNHHFKTESNDQLFHYEEPKPEPIPEPEPEVIDNGITVLITGATSGIGKATAAIFAKNGYRLILTGRRADRLEALKTEFETEFRNRTQLLNFDVRSLEEVKKSLSELEEDFKNVDILINNAGLASGLAPIHEGEIEDWDTMIDTNIKGLLYMTRAIAPNMVKRRTGHIVNIGSIAGKEIYPNGNVYSASKFAVDALTRAMRVDLHKYNIRVSQVSPGAVEETEFALVRFHGDAEKASIYKDFTPLKASDVAETIYFMVTRPEYVNIQDVVMMGTQQGSANHFDRSGRTDIKEE